MLLTSGVLVEFKTGYLQIAQVEHQCEVILGTDTNNGATGFAVGRPVRLYRHTDGSCAITVATTSYAGGIGDATHIVAQADDSLDTTTIKGEQFNYNPTGILANTSAEDTVGDITAATATMKRVALWKIINSDDVKIIPVKHATVSVVR